MSLTTPAYSALLLEFVEPLATEDENDDYVYQRCRMRMTAWNYHVSQKFKLQMFAAIEDQVVFTFNQLLIISLHKPMLVKQ